MPNESNDNKKENRKTAMLKEAMVAALEANMNNVTLACKKIGINRWTHYEWVKIDEAYSKAVLEVREMQIDFTESKLFELINGVKVEGVDGNVYRRPPCKTSVYFFLNNQAKHRGYRHVIEDPQNGKKITKIEVTYADEENSDNLRSK